MTGCRRTLVAGTLVLLVACAPQQPAPDLRPSDIQSTPETASAGATATAGDSTPPATPLTPSTPASADPMGTRFPTPSGWEPREQEDPDAGAIPWSSERDVAEVMPIWASYSCSEAGDLPVPVRIHEGAFSADSGAPAVVELIHFADVDEARRFEEAYLTGSLSCGATSLSPRALHRDIDGSVWTELIRAEGTEVTLVITQQELTDVEVEELDAQLASRG